ncbi:MAG TPA: GNAT family N-acetyltransferase [Desulfobacteraceae bacterium]|nr:GNAT family N-acetyltransferase [Desulfobacteraceae bacterium]
MTELQEDLHIRTILAEDAEQISEIQTAITNPSEFIDFKQIIERHVRNENDAGLVAELNGRVVGYMISYVLFGGFGLQKSAWIATLGVHPKFMGQGIGKRLAEETLRIYREKGVEDIYTSVRWDSLDLLSFFKTLGFDRSRFINLKKRLVS